MFLFIFFIQFIKFYCLIKIYLIIYSYLVGFNNIVTNYSVIFFLTNDWEQCTLNEISNSFMYGLNAPAKKYNGIYKYLRITDISDESHKFMYSNLTSPDAPTNKIKDFILKKGDIVFARTGATVGKTYKYDTLDGKVCFAGFLIKMETSSNTSTEFIFQNTLTQKYRNFVSLTSQRSGQPGINANEFSKYQLYIPNYIEQTKIGQYFKALDSLITLHQ